MSSRIIIDKPTHFKNIIASIAEFIQEINLSFRNEGIVAQAMDSSHISLVNLNISSEYFEKYEIEEECDIGIRLNLFHKILKCCDSDKIGIEVVNNGDKMNIEFIGKNKSEYELNLMDIEMDNLGIPDTDYHYILHKSYKSMSTLMKKIAVLAGSEIEFIVSDNIFKVKTKDDEDLIQSVFTVANEGEDEDEDETNFIVSEDADTDEKLLLTFSFTHIQKFFKISGLSNNVTISFMNDVPLRVSYNFEGGEIEFYLAPKINDDDD
jgi:proliferating cell nuclear antigen